MKINDDDKDDPIFFDDYDPEALLNIIDTQTKITTHMKKNGKKNMFQILIIIDDFADNPQFSRSSRLLHSLYTRGRHSFISTITATQVLVALSPIIRKNATEIYVYRFKELQGLRELIRGIISPCP